MNTGWIVLICIVLFFAFLLWFPIRICLANSDDGFVCSIKLLFWRIPILPREEKELTEEEKKKLELKKQRKAEKKAARDAKKKAQENKKKKPTTPETKKKRTLQEIFHLIQMIAQSGGKLARRFWRGFVIDKLTLHMAVAGSDAADTAISYGKVNAQVYAGYSFLMQYVTLKNTDIQIVPDFLSEKSRMEISCELFFRVGTLLASGFSAVWHFLKLILKDKNDAANLIDQQEKAAVKQ